MQSQGEFTMVVLPDLAVTTTSLPLAVPGTPHSAQLQFSNPEFGWPVTWDITQGALPDGLTLSESGLISGTPGGPDTKTFTGRAREQFRRFGERQLTLTVAAALQAKSPSLALGRIGVRFASSVSAVGGLAPLRWLVASGTLPRGLSFNTTTGTIRGIPRAAGASALTFVVTDTAGQRATTAGVVRVLPRLRIETRALAAAIAGRAYKTQLGTNGLLRLRRVQWTIARGSLPRGIRLEHFTGTLTGTPRQAGTFRFTAQAKEHPGGGTATKTFTLVVRP